MNMATQTIMILIFRLIDFKTEVCTVWVLLLSLVWHYGGIIKQIMTNPSGDTCLTLGKIPQVK